MTDMKSHELFEFPTQGDAPSVQRHQEFVCRFFSDIFDEIEAAVESALPKVLGTFNLYEGPVDLAVHAPISRYLIKQHLQKNSKVDVREDDVQFEMVRVSNCGLCIRTAVGDIRVLKAPHDGLPKALGEARVQFSTNAQLSFPFVIEDSKGVSTSTINLFVLWRMNRDHEFVGMEIACPKSAKLNGDIDCFWIHKWDSRRTLALVQPIDPSESDLDEITPVDLPDEDFGNK